MDGLSGALLDDARTVQTSVNNLRNRCSGYSISLLGTQECVNSI
jgi:hypothetical protein